MTTDELPAFTSRILAVAELYNEKLSEAKILLYFDALLDLPLETVFRGFKEAVQQSDWFPRPARVREIVLGTRTDKAEAAWIAWKEAARRHGSYTSLIIEDPALAETIIAVFTSWPAACALELSDEMWSSKRKEFERVYRIMERRELKGPLRLAGLAEIQNTNPEWQKHTPVAHIGDSDKPKALEA